MALAETAKLVVDLSLKGNFISQTSKINRALNTMDAKLSRTEGRAYKAGQQIGTGIKRGAAIAAVGVGLLVTQVAQGLQSLIKLEGMTAQTEAVLKSTGGVAGVTAVDVRKLAEKYEALNATIGDEVIQNAENLLLTFTKVNKKAFEPALLAALNMNQALGGGPEGLAGTVKLVGKALQDPEKGLSRLGRAIGGFSEGTTKAVKAALKNNDTLGAQTIILAELERRYGTSFLAGGATTAGKVAKFGDAIEDLQRNLAVALLPAVSNIADALTELLADPEVIAGTQALGAEIGKLFSKQNIKDGIAALKEGFGVIKSLVGPIAEVVGIAVKAFTSLPPELQKLAVGALAVNKLTGGLVTNLAGGLIGAVLSSFKGAMHVTAGVVQVTGPMAGVPGAGVAAGAAKTGLSTLGKVFLIGEAVGLVAAVNQVRDSVRGDVTKQAQGVSAQAQVFLGSSPTTAALQNSLAGVNKGIKDLESDPLAVALVTGPALDELRATRVAIQTQLGDKITTSVEDMRGKIATELDENKAAVDQVKAAALETKREAAKGAAFGQQGISATNAGAAKVAAAVYASTPTVITTVNVTANSVTKTVQVTKRYGSPNGSRNQGNTNEGGMGGH